ncbi:single-stranded DNA-binding protein [Myxosarcina sp. GI1]|uniref:single-stranded DNA-binding protein n=1 Tax=Myxosarcina sp. GI1 TaxID=1541065 RepID=UPI000567B5AF|nr:single-stranded DNA-binding protein [Myxosarcina sp. GI1]
MGLNVVNLVGRAGAEPEIIHFQSGSMLCKLPLAVDRRSRNNDKPDWFNLEIWGKTAEIAGNYVRKGKLIGIQGSLKIDTWADRNNSSIQRSRPVIRVDRLELLGSKNDSDSGMVSGYPDE